MENKKLYYIAKYNDNTYGIVNNVAHLSRKIYFNNNMLDIIGIETICNIDDYDENENYIKINESITTPVSSYSSEMISIICYNELNIFFNIHIPYTLKEYFEKTYMYKIRINYNFCGKNSTDTFYIHRYSLNDEDNIYKLSPNIILTEILSTDYMDISLCENKYTIFNVTTIDDIDAYILMKDVTYFYKYIKKINNHETITQNDINKYINNMIIFDKRYESTHYSSTEYGFVDSRSGFAYYAPEEVCKYIKYAIKSNIKLDLYKNDGDEYKNIIKKHNVDFFNSNTDRFRICSLYRPVIWNLVCDTNIEFID